MDPRYARHLLLLEVGAAGQADLCAHRVVVSAARRGASVAAAYLERAGIEVAVDEEGATLSVESAADLAARDDLSEAADWVVGAFAAVEEIKRVVGAGRPGSLRGVRLSGGEEDR